MNNTNIYISSLMSKMKELNRLNNQDKQKVQDLLEAIKSREEQIEHIQKLLAAEGISLDGNEIVKSIHMKVSDMAYEVLSNQYDSQPIHYRELADRIMAEGKLIPGKDPAANLITHLSRDNRFNRTAPGTYALVEWGLKPMSNSRKRRRRKKS